MVQPRRAPQRQPLAEAERKRRRALLDREYQAFPGYAAFDVTRPVHPIRRCALIVDHMLGAAGVVAVGIELAGLAATLVRAL